ncbi:cohesin domain-containing protein [Melioribacteraceae bacterium 4301-Me]|uniref:cohesin domain-containing protein n=1 Tax=Pyranulibacter aquaticus TaxID=3163344 RepID=UPI0035966762
MRSFKISVVKFLTIFAAMLMLGTMSTFAQVSVSLPNVSGLAGSEKLGAINVGNLTGQNVHALQFTVTYDKNIVYITGVDVSGTIMDGKTPVVNADTANGTITVAWASPDSVALSGEGTLLNLVFLFRNLGTSALQLNNSFLFNAGNPSVSPTDGQAITAKIMVAQAPAVSATAGDAIMIPITVTTIEPADSVHAYQFSATFDKNVFTISGYDVSSTISDVNGGSVEVNPDNTNGTVSVAFASTTAVSGSGNLLYLTGTAVAAGVSDFKFTSFMFNNGTPTAGTIDGQVAVAAQNVAPTLTLSPADTAYTIAENTSIQIQLIGNDTPGDVLTYSASGMPAGATLSTSGLFSWTPNYDQGRTQPYVITFKVTDQGGLFATKSVSITVTNVNRAPSFTAEPANNTVVPVHNVPVYYTFQYQANDPDGDPLTFSLVSGPGSITTNGLYKWAPAPVDAGQSFIVVVQVTDGTATVTSTRTLKVSDTVTGVDGQAELPTKYELMQNYPNPFNPTTTIQFALPKESHVKLTVFNVLGQEVAVLIDRTMGAGYHTVNFNATNLNTGMYLYKIEAGNFVSIKKMLLIK